MYGESSDPRPTLLLADDDPVVRSALNAQMVVELLGAGAIAYVRKGVSGAQIAKALADALQAKAGLSRA